MTDLHDELEQRIFLHQETTWLLLFLKKDLGADNGQTLLVPSFYLVNAKDREDHKCPPLLAWEYDEQKFLFGYV